MTEYMRPDGPVTRTDLSKPPKIEPLVKRSTYLIAQTMMMTGNGNIFMAKEAVYSTAMEEGWDLDEEKTWAQWETVR